MDALLSLCLVASFFSFGACFAASRVLEPRKPLPEQVASALFGALVGAVIAAVAALPFLG